MDKRDALAKLLLLMDTFAGEELGHVYGNGQEIESTDVVTELCAAFDMEPASGWWRTIADQIFADQARLDFLDRCNERLNAQCGTTYSWSLIMNHNVNRLMLGHMAVDLHDSAPPSQALPSCRAAIDAAMQRIREAQQP
ncbi:hypothetical protein [Sphingobium chungbukense]|uniref:Uncharacterized protein n=1 Tax=Sphingobium chungbukense TaxID=56193 RepID=A0A0M3AUN0_9SPHN|nr:hypothetical protein [Sphingobium chungbukense]KKW93902.1 hypothetical protein YP76_04445 [Sphingobium chungbukense]